jgi:hypothetical protein
MLKKELLGVASGIVLATTLGACNLGKSPQPTPDVKALYTAAANTLISEMYQQQTQTAEAATPTPPTSPTPLASFTALPTFPIFGALTPFGTAFTLGTPGAGITPLATSVGPLSNGFAVGCNNAVFIGETIKDGTKMAPRHDFDKAWSLLNAGTCTWDEGYSFAFKSGERMDGNDIKIVYSKDFTAPNHSNTFIVHLFAPKTAGEYKGLWQMKSDSAVWFGSLVSVDIIVQ